MAIKSDSLKVILSNGMPQLMKLRNWMYDCAERLSVEDRKKIESLLVCADKHGARLDYFLRNIERIENDYEFNVSFVGIQFTLHIMAAYEILKKHNEPLSYAIECCHRELHEKAKNDINDILEELKRGDTQK